MIHQFKLVFSWIAYLKAKHEEITPLVEKVAILETKVSLLLNQQSNSTTPLGGKVVLKSDGVTTQLPICPNECIVIEVKNYNGSILTWQTTTATSPIWTNVANSIGLSEITVCYPSVTTFYRVMICSTVNNQITVYSTSFKLSQSANCV